MLSTPGGIDAFHRLTGGGACFARRRARHQLDIGGKAVLGAECNRILAGFREHLELVRSTAANRAGIRLHHPKVEPGPLEHLRVRGVHPLVTRLVLVLAEVEGIGVLHDELTGAHHPEARANLIAKLGLDLVEVDRKLLVAANFATCDVGDDLFVGRSDAELAFVAVFEAQ